MRGADLGGNQGVGPRDQCRSACVFFEVLRPDHSAAALGVVLVAVFNANPVVDLVWDARAHLGADLVAD